MKHKKRIYAPMKANVKSFTCRFYCCRKKRQDIIDCVNFMAVKSLFISSTECLLFMFELVLRIYTLVCKSLTCSSTVGLNLIFSHKQRHQSRMFDCDWGVCLLRRHLASLPAGRANHNRQLGEKRGDRSRSHLLEGSSMAVLPFHGH